MELKYVNPNDEIVVASNLDPMEFVVFKNCENWVHKQIQFIIFSRKCPDCLKNKTLHNYHITNPNGMNQSFPCKQKYILWEKKN
jgi:hypothetical protein